MCLANSGTGSFLVPVYVSRVVDPDPDSVTLWTRIRIGNPDPGSGSRGKKVKKFQWKNALFSYLKKKFTTKKV
jgi:hypothetical protein